MLIKTSNKKKTNIEIPDAPTTHSEIHDTALPSTFSNFMVKMPWLQEKAVCEFFSRSSQGWAKVEVKGICLLLEDWFILVAAALRFLFPCCRILQASAKLCTLTHLRSGNATSGVTRPRASRPPRGQTNL